MSWTAMIKLCDGDAYNLTTYLLSHSGSLGGTTVPNETEGFPFIHLMAVTGSKDYVEWKATGRPNILSLRVRMSLIICACMWLVGARTKRWRDSSRHIGACWTYGLAPGLSSLRLLGNGQPVRGRGAVCRVRGHPTLHRSRRGFNYFILTRSDGSVYLLQSCCGT